MINPEISTVAMVCDTTSSFDVAKLFLAAEEGLGGLDVVIANVGTSHLGNSNGTDDTDMWWADATANFRTTHLAAHQFIRRSNSLPCGIFICINSGVDFNIEPGVSSHEFAQQLDCRLREFLTAEYPTMKGFSLDPGSVPMERHTHKYNAFEPPKLELVGLFSVWLGGGRADQLRGSYVQAEWDIRELELDMKQALKRNDLRHSLSSGFLGL